MNLFLYFKSLSLLSANHVSSFYYYFWVWEIHIRAQYFVMILSTQTSLIMYYPELLKHERNNLFSHDDM